MEKTPGPGFNEPHLKVLAEAEEAEVLHRFERMQHLGFDILEAEQKALAMWRLDLKLQSLS